ncbi:hypothetical protein ACVWZ4_001429 [Bradyrhizobium sp. USDA 4472]
MWHVSQFLVAEIDGKPVAALCAVPAANTGILAWRAIEEVGFATTLRTIASRPLGVKGAFLWTFIWSLPGTLKLRNLSFLGSDQMDNLLRDHS